MPLTPAQAGAQAFSIPGVAESPTLFEEPPPIPDLTLPPPRPAGLDRLVRKWEPVARDFRKSALGEAGEAIVYHHDRARLQAADRGDLAAKVRWVAKEDGDGAGYDIRSFDSSGEERFLEVKTTYGARTTPIPPLRSGGGGPRRAEAWWRGLLTRNEKGLAQAEPDRFRLYRIYDFAPQPKLFTLAAPLGLPQLWLEPETWRAGFG